MSSLTTLARPYAKAAFGLAHDAGALGPWQDMLGLAADIATHPEVDAVLRNPLVAPGEGVKLVADAGGERFDDRFRAFLDVLGGNRRLTLLPEIATAYQRFKQDAEKRLRVKVISAMPMNDEQSSRMRDALARRFDCDVELDTEIDSGILAGAVIYAGDQVIDGSLRGRLGRLSQNLGS
ncbi:F0F1 ATP synthase subunit delta [Elongatibacter sediminis]|uniref:ATP synthase subunit delta n=1 Tax=Elongatibacter sediminis TaxID=3119006 RepID=A0AAW9RHS1_9GAMM